MRARLNAITDQHTVSLQGVPAELVTEGLVPSVDVQIHHVPLTPAFKLYLFNGVEALHGPYEVQERKLDLGDGEKVTALDVLGLGATLTQHVRDANPESPGSVFVDSMQAWFGSVWRFLSEENRPVR
ncbi:hypothetical protein ACWCPM_30810 [Streptomyces sp. NPDC002309]